MIRQLKRFTLQLISGANIVLVVLLVLVGYSDRIDPEQHALLACAGMTFPFFLIANFLFLGFWTLFGWRRLWIPIAGFVLAYTPINIYMPVRVLADVPNDCQKVVTYNVSGFGGAGSKVRNAFDSIYDYFRQQRPDILCVVESNDTWRRSDTIFAKDFAHNRYVSLKQGVASWDNRISLHTRYPIVRSEPIAVESVTQVNGAAAFYLDTGTDTLLVVGCHLENVHLSSDDRRQYKEILKGEVERDTARAEGLAMLVKLGGAFQVRARQVKAIRRYVDEHRGRGPVIICGDFNDTPISFARHTLAEGLTDCFAAAGRGLGLSYNQKGFNFRIDHILCSPQLQPRRCIVDAKMNQSDHYPVVCWLKIADKP